MGRSSSKHRGKVVELSIDSLNRRGDGVACWQDNDKAWCVDVPVTVPGDRVQVELRHVRKKRLTTSLPVVLEGGADRVTPRCRHVGVCGGCRLQQMRVEAQLKWKEEAISQLFLPLAAVDSTFHPIQGMSHPWEYRNKMEFTFSQDREGKRFLGLLSSIWKGKVFNLEECHLCDPWYAQTLARVRRWWDDSGVSAYFSLRDTGSLRTLTLRRGVRTGERLVMLTVSGRPEYQVSTSQLNHLTEAVLQGGAAKVVLRVQHCQKGVATKYTFHPLHGEPFFFEELHLSGYRPLRFKVSPAAFFQPNTEQAERLYQTALQLAQLESTTTLMDLYCGTGTLALLAASAGCQVVGIELDSEAINDARENGRLNELNDVTFAQGDVGEVLSRFQGSRPDVVFVDPPRVGLNRAALDQIVSLGAPRLVYVSCNPWSQAENAAYLIEHGYALEQLQPIDQFPHTAHVENVIALVKGT